MDDIKLAGLTIQVDTPDGKMFVTISESKDGKPVSIWIHLGKTGAPLSAWVHALSRMMTFALDHGATINDLCEELSNHTSDRRRLSSDGISVRSGVEGVWIALMKYNRDKYEQLAKTLGDDIDERGRGPRLGR